MQQHSLLDYYDYTNVTDLEKAINEIEQQLLKINIPGKWISSDQFGMEQHELTISPNKIGIKSITLEFHHYAPYSPQSTGILFIIRFLCFR